MASNEWLVRKLHEQDKKIEALSRGGTGVGHTSIAPGENLTVISDNGEVVLGAGGVEYVDGPTPATPSAPTLKLGFGTIETTWDGTFAEGEDEDGVPLVAPVDFDVVEVHCSTDPEEEEWGEDTMRGQIKTREGGTITVGGFDVDDEVFVCLIALAKTGKRSAPSATASLVIEGLDFAQLTNELDAATVTIDNAREVLLDGQNTLGEKLDAADTALSGLEATLDNLDSTTLPALRSDLDAAEGRLDSAEGQIVDAFGEIAGARTDLAADATAKADAAEAAAKSAAQQYDTALKGQIDTTIDQAKSDLTADINAVRTSANGKNTVTWSTSTPPTSYSGAVSDTWFVMSGNGSGATVVSQWRWNGNVWVSTKLSQAVLAQIDIGTGTFGEMDGTRLKAGSIYADRIVSGLSQNMVPDPGFSNSEINASRLQRANAYGATMSLDNGMLVVSAPDGVTRGPDFSLSANSDLYAWAAYPSMPVVAKAQARIVGVGSVCELRYSIRFQLRDGTRKFVAMNPASYTSLTDEWVEVVGKYDLPQDAVGFSIVLQCRDNTVGTVEIRSPFVASSIGTTIIEPGAVTTDKVAANVLEVGNLKAGTAAIAEAVVAKIAAQTASIQQADVKNLFVTGTSSLSDVVAERIAADTAEFIELEVGNLVAGTGIMDEATINKLFTDVVVASMAQAEQFIGENAILTGAVTAPKITASEELWAKIGQFVKIRAEHIEADAIDGMVITGATIRSAATGARTLMSASGFEAYNTANERTFFASASTGEVSITGKLFTGKPGFSRVALDPTLWSNLPVYNDDGTVAGYANGAGVRVGIDASNSMDMYHAGISGSVRSGVIRGPGGVAKIVLNGGGAVLSGESSGENVTSDFVGRFRSRVKSTTDENQYSLINESTLSVGISTHWGSAGDSSGVSTNQGSAVLNCRDQGKHSFVSAYGGNIGLKTHYGGYDTSWLRLIGSDTAGSTYIDVSAEHINPLRINYAGTGDSWLIPFRKSGTDWGYVGSSGAMGVDDFGIQAATGKDLALVATGSSNINVSVNDSAGGRFRVPSVYNVTSSGSANVVVNAQGTLYRPSSSKRYKQDIEDFTPKPDILDIETKTWRDIRAVAESEKARGYLAKIGQGPLPVEFQDAELEPSRHFGAIAEEVHEMGLTELVEYDSFGRPDALKYPMFGVALIPSIRALRDRITELERLTNG